MKEIDDIISEQVLLLKWNGYTEKQLNNGEADGSYKEHLKLALQDILEVDKMLFDREPFQMHLFGCFNENKDKVLFTFSYEYDALSSQITLKEVQASLDNIPINISIEKRSDLWNSKELYIRVKELSSTIKTALLDERDIQIKNIIRNEVQLLKENGYTNSTLEKQLTSIINKIESSSSKCSRDLIISDKMKMGDNSDTMHYRLHYNYDSANTILKLKSMYGRIGEVNRIFFMENSTFPVPTADKIYTYLSHENRTYKAQSIVKQGNSPENLKKRLK